MNDPELLTMVAYKNISSTSNNKKNKKKNKKKQSLIYTFKTTVIESKLMQYCK